MSLYLSPLLVDLDWVEHGFATRHAVNWFDDARLAHLQQIHSSVVRTAARPGHFGEGDAVITNTAGVLAGVRTADCLPLLLADPVHRAVAAVHAGWRGSAADIASETLRAMSREFGTKAEDVIAAIGPGIGGCCYEVSEEVAQRFAAWLPEETERSGKRNIDLASVNRRQLASAGVRKIHSGAPCTKCDADYHSFRRDGEAAGRMYAVIGIRSGNGPASGLAFAPSRSTRKARPGRRFP